MTAPVAPGAGSGPGRPGSGSGAGRPGSGSGARRPGGRSRPIVGRALLIAWLAIVWTALWGDVHLGTLVAGALVGTLVVVALRSEVPHHPKRLHPMAAMRYAATFLWMLLVATWQVVRAVLFPRRRIMPAVVAVDLPTASDMVVTLVANSITLTPGTITLDARHEPHGTRLVVHALDASDPDAVRGDVERLYRLARAAFGGSGDPEEVSA